VDKHKLGIVITAISAAGFGSLAIFLKIAYSYGANVITLLTLRFCMASIFFLVIMKLMNIPWQLTRTNLLYLIGLGVAGYGVMSNLFFYGVSLIPASIASLVLYTYPTMVCLLAFLLGDEEMFPQKIGALTVSAVGLILVIGPSFGNIEIRGITAVFAAAVVFSLYFIVSNRVLKEAHWLVGSAVVSISAAVFFGVGGFVIGVIDFTPPWQVLASAVGIALFSTVLAVGGLYAGISMIGPSKAAIVSTLEPVVTIILAAIVFEEMLTMVQFVGGALILSSIMILQLTRFGRQLETEKELK